MLSHHIPRGPGGLQIEAAGDGINVEHFAAKNPAAPPPIIAICGDCGISYFWLIRVQRYCFSLIKEEKFPFFFCRYDRFL